MKWIKKSRTFKNSNEGAAGIVVAILLLGLFISMIAFVQSTYVPQWMEQKEAEHMEQVATQFGQLKFVVDTLSISENTYTPVSSPITLGSKEMPFLSSQRSYGKLNLIQSDFKIEIGCGGSARDHAFQLGSLEYSSNNAYYIDQKHIFENGALIISQSSGSFISASPAFSFAQNEFSTQDPADNNKITLNLIRLKGINGKNSASGFGTFSIQTKFISSEKLDTLCIKNITIYTKYTDAWKEYFKIRQSDYI